MGCAGAGCPRPGRRRSALTAAAGLAPRPAARGARRTGRNCAARCRCRRRSRCRCRSRRCCSRSDGGRRRPYEIVTARGRPWRSCPGCARRCGLRRDLPRADDRDPQRPAGRRAPPQRTAACRPWCTCTAATPRRSPTATRPTWCCPSAVALAGCTRRQPTGGPRSSRATRDYRYPMTQRAAPLWYHDHRMDFTGPAGLPRAGRVAPRARRRRGRAAAAARRPRAAADDLRPLVRRGRLARYPALDPGCAHARRRRESYIAGRVRRRRSWSTARRGRCTRSTRPGTGCGSSTPPTRAATSSRSTRRRRTGPISCRSAPTSGLLAAPVAHADLRSRRRNGST